MEWVFAFVVPPLFFFFKDSAPTEIYTLSLHDALPISISVAQPVVVGINPQTLLSVADAIDPGRRQTDLQRIVSAEGDQVIVTGEEMQVPSGLFVLILDRKSTRLNSSHVRISYAVFCLK